MRWRSLPAPARHIAHMRPAYIVWNDILPSETLLPCSLPRAAQARYGGATSGRIGRRSPTLGHSLAGVYSSGAATARPSSRCGWAPGLGLWWCVMRKRALQRKFALIQGGTMRQRYVPPIGDRGHPWRSTPSRSCSSRWMALWYTQAHLSLAPLIDVVRISHRWRKYNQLRCECPRPASICGRLASGACPHAV